MTVWDQTAGQDMPRCKLSQGFHSWVILAEPNVISHGFKPASLH